MPKLDEILIQRSKKGDVQAFEELVRRYEDRIHRFSSRMCRHVEDAQDVFQDTFLAAFKSLKDFKGKAKLATWFYRIASNACMKKRRKGKYEPQQVLSLEDFLPNLDAHAETPQVSDWSKSPIRRLEDEEARRRLDEAILALPGEYRIVLVLRDMEGLSAEETSKALGIGVAAVKSRLHRARLFVRGKLSEYHEKK